MPLFGKPDEAKKLFWEAERYVRGEEFNLDKAIHLLEEAVMLKPHEDKYRKELERLQESKSKLHKRFLMQVEDVFWVKRTGVVAAGKVQQGTIRSGDKVRIMGHQGEKRDTVISLAMRKCPFAIAGEVVGLVLKTLDKNDVQRGDTIEKVEDEVDNKGTGTAK